MKLQASASEAENLKIMLGFQPLRKRDFVFKLQEFALYTKLTA